MEQSKWAAIIDLVKEEIDEPFSRFAMAITGGRPYEDELGELQNAIAVAIANSFVRAGLIPSG